MKGDLRQLCIAWGVMLLGGVGVVPDLYCREEERRAEEVFSVLAVRLAPYLAVEEVPLGDASRELRVGVYDKTSQRVYFREFEALTRRLKIRMSVTDLADYDGIDKLDMVYVADDRGRLPLGLFEALEGKPILVIVESERLLAEGGVIQFFRNEDGEPRWRINLGAALERGIELHPDLLELAVEVRR